MRKCLKCRKPLENQEEFTYSYRIDDDYCPECAEAINGLHKEFEREDRERERQEYRYRSKSNTKMYFNRVKRR